MLARGGTPGADRPARPDDGVHWLLPTPAIECAVAHGPSNAFARFEEAGRRLFVARRAEGTLSSPLVVAERQWAQSSAAVGHWDRHCGGSL
jgi:hypothetical protein